MLAFQVLILYKVQISRVLAFYFDLSRSRHSHLSQWFLMRPASPSLCKSFQITSNHPQSPPITTNHSPMASKFADQSPSNHFSCFIHNHARSHCSKRRRSDFNDQSMWESSYFFTWGAAITMMMIMMITIMVVMVDDWSSHVFVTCACNFVGYQWVQGNKIAITISSSKQGRLR